MIVRLFKGTSCKSALNHIEKSVKEEKAKLIYASGFLYHEMHSLNDKEKIKYIEACTKRNSRSKVNSYHFSLDFHKEDKLTKDMICIIAKDLLKGVGFENQPYILYERYDAGHPRYQILTTNILWSGKRVNDSFIYYKMRKAAERVEDKFELIQTGRKKNKEIKTSSNNF